MGFETKQNEGTAEFGRKDINILLPTGYGKRFYYATIPMILYLLGGNIGSLVTVKTPNIIQHLNLLV